MNTLILLRTAIRAIIRHKGRSFLTVLGIMIGIGAIVVTFSIGRGAEEKIKGQIMGMGEGAVYIIPGNVVTRRGIRSSSDKPARLTTQDLEAIKKQIPEIKEVSRLTYSIEEFNYKGVTANEQLLGVDPSILKINDNKLQYGEFFTKDHVKKRMNVVVLYNEIAKRLFENEYPIGKTIKINGTPFIVIGVMEPIGHYWGPEDPNRRAFIPYTVAKKYVKKPDELEEDLGAMALGLYKVSDNKEVLRKIKRILRFRHNIEHGEEDDFTIFDQESISQAAEDAARVIKLFGLIAASISLIVGGIGVMNIMLVSVQERTREIGIRMAIGATQWVVQLQFLIEAIVLCALGGIIGIGLGLLGMFFISNFTQLPGIIEITPLVASFLVTIIIGIFFGYYPARKASLLNPIDALLER